MWVNLLLLHRLIDLMDEWSGETPEYARWRELRGLLGDVPDAEIGKEWCEHLKLVRVSVAGR